jgi:polyribonucleotide nucleotidyltransferase
MDFKVAGTKDGICALQLDVKINHLTLDILNEAIDRAEQARFIVLDNIRRVLSEPRKEISQLAPRITILKIDQSKIGNLIGPGGKTIRKIIEETGTTIDIEDDGTVVVAASEGSNQERALEMIKGLTEDIEIGRVYSGKITRIMPFGAFCEIASNKEGLIHISELANSFVKNVEDVVKLGDSVKVKVIEIDELGRINLSKKQVDEPKTQE